MGYSEVAVSAFLTFCAALMLWLNLEWRKQNKERHEAFMQDRIYKKRPARCPQCGWDMDNAEPVSRDVGGS